jgi:hypothetical protein
LIPCEFVRPEVRVCIRVVVKDLNLLLGLRSLLALVLLALLVVIVTHHFFGLDFSLLDFDDLQQLVDIEHFYRLGILLFAEDQAPII